MAAPPAPRVLPTTRAAATTGIGERAPFELASLGAKGSAKVGIRFARSVPWAVCLITAVAALLRFAELDDVAANPFYDAAVRSMSRSWHNLLFGAFDPGAFLAVDKPPLDLWLQVASVKLFGWNPGALKLPEALGGTLCVPLLYDTVRRVAGRPAGLGAAIALAVLPISVLTSRSDTMDSLMMLLVLAALWLTIRASSSGRRRALILAGVALGLAFNVKLFEALIALPALLVLYWLAASESWRGKLVNVLLAGVALVAVGLSWAITVSLAPGRHPFPAGSTDGTAWNVIFVFNGFGRVSAHGVAGAPGGPGVLRLFAGSSWHFDALLGCVLVAAIALGATATAASLLGRRRRPRVETPPLARAFVIALTVWIGTGVVLFSHVAVLHTRYLETLAPPLAAAIGYGAASLAGLCGRSRAPAPPSMLGVAVALAAIGAYASRLRPSWVVWECAGLSLAAVGGAMVAGAGSRSAGTAKWLTAALVIATAVLFPVHESLSLVRSKASNSLGLYTRPAAVQNALSDYLEPRTMGRRFELAVDEPLSLAPLISHDQRPILPLTSLGGVGVVGLAELLADVRAGAVRYGLIGSHRCNPRGDKNAACGPAARWIRDHGIDVTSQLGSLDRQRLYLLPSY